MTIKEGTRLPLLVPPDCAILVLRDFDTEHRWLYGAKVIEGKRKRPAFFATEYLMAKVKEWPREEKPAKEKEMPKEEKQTQLSLEEI